MGMHMLEPSRYCTFRKQVVACIERG
jgi:hypothetical protein